MPGRIVVFSTSACPHCKRAKRTLHTAVVDNADQVGGLAIHEVNLDLHPNRREEMYALANAKTVPQIFLNGRCIGGNDQLEALVESGKLLDELKACANEEYDGKPSPPSATDSTEADNVKAGLTAVQDPFLPLIKRIRMKKGGVSIKNRMYHLRMYSHCFVGSELVDWLVENEVGKTSEEREENGEKRREQAVKIGGELYRRGYFRHVVYEHEFEDAYLFYRFCHDEKEAETCLNVVKRRVGGGEGDKDEERDGIIEVDNHDIADPSALAKALRREMLTLYDAFLSDDGRHVDYEGMKKSPLFSSFCEMSRRLHRVDVSSLTRDELLAFYSNVYNAVVVHANVVIGPPTNGVSRALFFTKSVKYLIGGCVYTLNDIEHGVLRGNEKPPYTLRRQFGARDVRNVIAQRVLPKEPRVHFALVCGAKSCPPIRTYSAESIDEELSAAAAAFFDADSGCVVDADNGAVKLNKILDWYSPDFPADRIGFALSHMTKGTPKYEQLHELVVGGKSIKLSFLEYDWSLNGA